MSYLRLYDEYNLKKTFRSFEIIVITSRSVFLRSSEIGSSVKKYLKNLDDPLEDCENVS